MPEKTPPPAWLVGPLMTAGVLLLAELALRNATQAVSTAFVVAALIPVAYAGLRGGLGPSLACALLVTGYTIHFVGYPAPFALTGVTLGDASLMTILAAGMATTTSLVRAREQRLRRALAQRAAELERRNRELTEANAALEAFGYVVSHDLKEPVRAIENYLEAAEESYGTATGRADLAKAAEANGRLVRLLHGLLSYARASSVPAAPRALDIAAVVEGEACRAMYDALRRERDARVEAASDLPRALVDEIILAQVLGNLILNAIRHHPGPGARVRVVALADAAPGRVHLAVEDDGPGFPADILRRFGKGGDHRPANLRTGFGLVIAQRGALRMGGELWLENLPEGGARAHLDLPGVAPRLAKS